MNESIRKSLTAFNQLFPTYTVKLPCLERFWKSSRETLFPSAFSEDQSDFHSHKWTHYAFGYAHGDHSKELCLVPPVICILKTRNVLSRLDHTRTRGDKRFSRDEGWVGIVCPSNEWKLSCTHESLSRFKFDGNVWDSTRALFWRPGVASRETYIYCIYSVKRCSALLIFGVLVVVLIRGRHSLRNHNICKW